MFYHEEYILNATVPRVPQNDPTPFNLTGKRNFEFQQVPTLRLF